MKIPIFQIDAFAEKPFEGNPAAVCPLDAWLPDAVMQSIAGENNLSETAFFVPTDGGFHIRWFTPVTEVDLCGHATLASAFTIFSILGYPHKEIAFESRSGRLMVRQEHGRIVLDFPAQPPVECAVPESICRAFGLVPAVCLKAEDYVVVLDSEEAVRHVQPDFVLLKEADGRGVVITARSDEVDFVTRFFAPKFGIDEDPVTGSAYTQLVPYWAGVTGDVKFHARQLSRRGGDVFCELAGDRVLIAGKAVPFLSGEIEI